jgi:hypothetical protein
MSLSLSSNLTNLTLGGGSSSGKTRYLLVQGVALKADSVSCCVSITVTSHDDAGTCRVPATRPEVDQTINHSITTETGLDIDPSFRKVNGCFLDDIHIRFS